MKVPYFCYLISTLVFVGCSGKRANKTDETAEVNSDTTNRTCYIATYEKDTAYVSIDDPNAKNVKGALLLQYRNNPKNDGTFEGSFHGDTLLADYTYTIGSYKEKIIKNPIALLKKGDSLILGVGEIETKMGRSYFKPGTTINFNKGRFRFIKDNCRP